MLGQMLFIVCRFSFLVVVYNAEYHYYLLGILLSHSIIIKFFKSRLLTFYWFLSGVCKIFNDTCTNIHLVVVVCNVHVRLYSMCVHVYMYIIV